MTALIENLRASVGAYLPELTEREDLERTALRLDTFAASTWSHDETAAGPASSGPAQTWAADLPGSSTNPDSNSHDPQFGRWFRLLAAAWSRDSRRRLHHIKCLADPGQVEQGVLDHLTDLVGSQVLRALLDALERRRKTGALAGPTPETRFHDFRAWLSSGHGRRTIAEDYRHTLTQAFHRVKQFLNHVDELLERYQGDLQELSARMAWTTATTRIAHLSWGSGDTHNGGRSVAVLELDNDHRIVYKPRDLSSDVAFHRAVSALVDHGVADLRCLKVLPRMGYGWMEYVDSAQQPTPQEKYFERIGAVTALLHVLHATDMHFENVVTDSQGYPVVVDTETLLTPKPRLPAGYGAGAASTIGQRLLNESVASIGTLPLAVSVPGRGGSIDIGATGFTESQKSPFRSHVLREAGQDTMHLAFENLPPTGHNTNPVASARDAAELLDRRDSIQHGFRAVMSWIRRNRATIGAQLRQDLRAAPLRYVHAPTVFYTQLLRIAAHPSVSEDQASQLAVLGRVYIRDPYASGDQVPRHELHQLQAGDVPYFMHRAGDTVLRTVDGTPVRHDFFEADGMELLERGLRRAEPAAVEQQCNIIEDLFVRLIPDNDSGTGVSAATIHSPAGTPAHQDNLLGRLHAVATEIAAAVIPSTDPRHPSTWVGPLVTADDAEQWNPGTLGYDLYGGSPGLALALAGVGALTEDHRLLEVSQSVLDPIEEQLSSGALADQDLSAGAATGMSGTAWAIATARRISGRPDPDKTLRSLDQIADNLPSQRRVEFTTGSIGALAAANALWSHGDIADNEAGRGMVRRIGDSVVEQTAKQFPQMKAEAVAPSTTKEPLYTGYAHGLAGMIPHLITYGTQFSDQRALLLAGQMQQLLALAFDGTDWARRPGTRQRSWAWCHGAPGLLQSWAETRRHAPDAADPEELSTLRELTLTRGLGNNSTYCHGDLGSLDGLLEAARAEGDQHATQMLRRATRSVVENQLDPRRARPRDRYSYTDSLFVGRSGQLWAGLRAVDHDLHPSVLCLG